MFGAFSSAAPTSTNNVDALMLNLLGEIVITPTNITYEDIFHAVGFVESKCNPNIVNEAEQAVGYLQIRRIRLLDYYQQTGIFYTLHEMKDIAKAKEVFMYYAKKYPPDNFQQICREWNGGPNGMNKKSTEVYYQLVYNQLKK